jgi:hypothetical protein
VPLASPGRQQRAFAGFAGVLDGSMHAAWSGHRCSGAAAQPCSDAVMQRCSDAAMLASLVSHRPVLVRWLFVEKRARELLDSWEWTLLLWRP